MVAAAVEVLSSDREPGRSVTPAPARCSSIAAPRRSLPTAVSSPVLTPSRARPYATLAGDPPGCSVMPSGVVTMSMRDSPITTTSITCRAGPALPTCCACLSFLLAEALCELCDLEAVDGCCAAGGVDGEVGAGVGREDQFGHGDLAALGENLDGAAVHVDGEFVGPFRGQDGGGVDGGKDSWKSVCPDSRRSTMRVPSAGRMPTRVPCSPSPRRMRPNSSALPGVNVTSMRWTVPAAPSRSWVALDMVPGKAERLGGSQGRPVTYGLLDQAELSVAGVE